jgi:hypothetical protein
MGAIEWPALNISSNMSVEVVDNTDAPARVLDASSDTTVRIKWTVPDEYKDVIGGHFRLRVYAESIGPGQELQIGTEKFVPVVVSQEDYTQEIVIPGSTLEGENTDRSGVYKIVAVLQHTNPSTSPSDSSDVSGFAESTMKMFRTP